MCSLYISYTIGTTVCYKKFYLLLFWSRHVYADLAMHATLAALGTLPRSVPVSPWARSATCKPCPMVLVPDGTVHCSRPRCCSGRDSCMLTSRCMLPWLRSAPYPALRPCEPQGPVGDMQAVSYGARSRQYSPLLPASSSEPPSIVERPRSGPMGGVHVYILPCYASHICDFCRLIPGTYVCGT